MRSALLEFRPGPHVWLALAIASVFATPGGANTIDFDSFPLGGAGFYNGSNGAGDFAIDHGTFSNNFSNFGGGCCWEGWSVSNHGDTTTPGFANQYSSITGGGFAGGGQFGVAFSDVALITFASPETLAGTYLTNTTYAALSMLNGDGFAKQFGGASGTDADWFNVTIEGRLGGSATGNIVFYLADYRFANSVDDYIIDDWTWVELGSLGLVDQLAFTFGSSDAGAFGVNTPTYFALDSLTSVPEPGSAALLGFALASLGIGRRRSSSRRA